MLNDNGVQRILKTFKRCNSFLFSQLLKTQIGYKKVKSGFVELLHIIIFTKYKYRITNRSVKILSD
jgi:hypothetical protein